MEFQIEPLYSAVNNSLVFEAGDLNYLADTQFNDKFGTYQALFGVYSYMQITSEKTFRIHYPDSTPFVWQAHNSCSWDPTGQVVMRSKEVTPCRIKLNEQWCYDEFMDSTFNAYLRWSQNPTVELSALGMAAADSLARHLIKNATLGHRMILSAGQLFDSATVEFNEGVPSNIQDAFVRANDACRGWIEMLIEQAAAGSTWLNSGAIDTTDISADGLTYVGTTSGDAVALYDEIFADAQPELQAAIIEGGVSGFTNPYFPLFIVSNSILRAIHTAWQTQKESALQNETRISRVPYSITTPGGTRTINVFMIDDTVVVPASEVGIFDRYLTGRSHFAYLTLSGVIQLGSNFQSLPVVNQSEIGLLIQKSDRVEDYGTYKYLAHSLVATAINNENYIAGDYLYAEPA